MTDTHKLATALEALAARLREHPSTPCGSAGMYIRADNKEQFIALVKALPRPLTKKPDSYGDLDLVHDDGILRITASARQSDVCRLVSPAREAVYECDALLSEAEEKELERP